MAYKIFTSHSRTCSMASKLFVNPETSMIFYLELLLFGLLKDHCRPQKDTGTFAHSAVGSPAKMIFGSWLRYFLKINPCFCTSCLAGGR